MYSANLAAWRRVATEKIRFKKDRLAVQEELRQHMEEKWNDYIAQGVPEKDLDLKIIEDMGSAKELAPILGQIHKPHLGYTMIVLKWVMIAMLVITCILGNSATSHTITDSAFTETESRGFTRIYLLEPKVSFKCDSYRLTVQKAALWESSRSSNSFTNTTITRYSLRLQIKVTQPPFQPQFSAWEYFWAEDSQGNRYMADMEAMVSSSDWYQTHFAGMYSRIFYDVGYLSISGIPSPDIKWMDLHFDLDGRDVTVRIELPGGASL